MTRVKLFGDKEGASSNLQLSMRSFHVALPMIVDHNVSRCRRCQSQKPPMFGLFAFERRSPEFLSFSCSLAFVVLRLGGEIVIKGLER